MQTPLEYFAFGGEDHPRSWYLLIGAGLTYARKSILAATAMLSFSVVSCFRENVYVVCSSSSSSSSSASRVANSMFWCALGDRTSGGLVWVRNFC